MKRRIVLALAFVFATTLIGCGSDDSGSSNISIVGKWKTEKFDYYRNGQFEETQIIVEENASCPDNVEFKSDGTYVVLELDADCNDLVDDSGTYEFNGTTITYTSDGFVSKGTVMSLNATDMKVDYTETALDGVVYKNVGYFKRI